MRKRFFGGILALPLLVALIMGCKSAPAVSESAARADRGLDGETARALEAALARLETARKQAHDFGGPEFLPEETAAADARYDAVMAAARDGGVEAARAAITESAALADVYDDIFARALGPYASAKGEAVIEAREEAVFMGIAEYSPDRLAAVDDIADEALRLYQDEEDYYAAKDTADRAINMYGVLARGAEARSEAYEIEFYRFQDLDPDNLARAGRRLEEGLAAFDAGDLDAARAAAEESLGIYRGILNQGMKSYAEERRLAALEERRFAEEHKAPVAVRLDFENAARIFDLGETAYGQEQYREAANLYFQAEFSFAAAAGVAEVKRVRAEEAIRRAEELATASEETARAADTIVGEEVLE
ncbi:MAG: hypothetical protein LBC88_05840 [Spirochaetaceae bacterium]|jgi:hypothetical protein|nr:hypothetical protein [Spirochaetaceae bacterium]